MVKIYALCTISFLFITGCAVMYAPITWGHRDEVYRLIASDPLLSALYNRFDSKRSTLRGPNGYDEVVFPFEARSRVALYNSYENIIYINREINFNDAQIKKILTHEFSHYLWDTGLDRAKKTEWKEYLQRHPSPLQRLVGLYYPESRRDVENFAFTVEFPRPEDIKELVSLAVLSESEGNAVLSNMKSQPKPDYWGIGMFDIEKEKGQ